MTKKYYLALAVGTAAAILVSAGPLAAHDCNEQQAKAATPTAQAPTVFADKNSDGKVTRQEAKVDPALARSFNRYDLDDNEVLDRGEFARLEDASAENTLAARSLELNYDYDYDMNLGSENRPRDALRPRHVAHPAPQ